jgi:hypothetical protein
MVVYLFQINNKKKELPMVLHYLHAQVSEETYIELKKAALDARLTLRQYIKKMAEEYVEITKKKGRNEGDEEVDE